ncbi:hypothetical protein MUK42_04685 [Musa troglodytarum]|uniref:Uncharacterized protein n=1 Tax=Musa troglodytarum TaxID=320322 RepID=A0A9E7GDE3_9LILI|nr:hypothetical protein MUK42_04685 [Musa troglodytarum]
MGSYTRRLLLLAVLLCVVLLSSWKPEPVCGLRNNEEQTAVAKSERLLASVDAAVDIDASKKPAAGPSPFDPYSASKRRVRRGSDPIHNRC